MAYGVEAQLLNQETWTDFKPNSEWNHVVFTQEPDEEIILKIKYI